MKRHQKQARTEAIINIITDSSGAISISEIFQKLSASGLSGFSRKTIERDVADLIKKHVLYESSKNPLTVSFGRIYGTMMHLTHEEITYLIVILPETHPISLRLKNTLGIGNEEMIFENS
jgi:hypothetical protein